MSSIETIQRRGTDTAFGPSLRLATPPPVRNELPRIRSDEEPVELRLGFQELVLIHRSLEAVRTLGLVEDQNDRLTDALQLIDVVLEEAV